jgi:hypothetical protein
MEKWSLIQRILCSCSDSYYIFISSSDRRWLPVLVSMCTTRVWVGRKEVYRYGFRVKPSSKGQPFDVPEKSLLLKETDIKKPTLQPLQVGHTI